MNIQLRKNRLYHDEFVALLLRRARMRSLADMLRAILKYRYRSEWLSTEALNGLFLELIQLCEYDSDALETKLILANSPPSLGSNTSWERFFWAELVYIILDLKYKFREDLSSALVQDCLKRPTSINFALGHSTVVAKLASSIPDLLDPSLIEVTVSGTHDSRSIYGLKVSRWLPDWAAIRGIAFDAMLSGPLVKRFEAMWLLNERGTQEEVLSMASARGIVLNETIIASGGICAVTRAILNTRLPSRSEAGLDYAISPDGSYLQGSELEDLSGLVRRALEREE